MLEGWCGTGAGYSEARSRSATRSRLDGERCDGVAERMRSSRAGMATSFLEVTSG